MRSIAIPALIVFAIATLYWLGINLVSGTREPWDAAGYWIAAYPIGIGLAAMAGRLLRRHGWIAGALVIFAQLPVMLAGGGVGPLLPAGILVLAVTAIPAMIAAALAARFTKRR